MVVASGNLGLVSFTAMDERMTVEDIEASYPGLVDALANHPGIGLLMLRSAAHGAIAVGRDGINYLDEDRVEGESTRSPSSASTPRRASSARTGWSTSRTSW